MKYRVNEKGIHVYRAGGYVIAHVTRRDTKKDAYRVYSIVDKGVIGQQVFKSEGKRIYKVSSVATADKIAKIPFGDIEIHGVELVTDEAEVRLALGDFITGEPLAEGTFNGTRLLIEG